MGASSRERHQEAASLQNTEESQAEPTSELNDLHCQACTTRTGQRRNYCKTWVRLMEQKSTMVKAVTATRPGPWLLVSQLPLQHLCSPILKASNTWVLFQGTEELLSKKSQHWVISVHTTKGGFHNWQKHAGIKISSSSGYAWNHPGRRGWAHYYLPKPRLSQFTFKPSELPLKRDFQTHPYITPYRNLACCCLSHL